MTPIDAFDRPVASAAGDSAAEGNSGAAARADHKHAREAADANLSGTPTTSAVGDSAAVGSSTTGSRSDHRHGREAFATTADIADVAASESAGSAATVARADHVHALPALGAWTGYTPTLTQSGAVTKTVTYAKYAQFGKTVHVQVKLAITGSGTGANPVAIGLPVTAAQSGTPIGAGWVFDTSASALYKGVAQTATTTTVQLYNTGDTSQSSLGATGFTAALAAGDEVTFNGTYESV